MIPVFQKPMDGQCMRACICSIFEIPMEKGPRVQCDGHVYDEETKAFICTIPEHRNESKWTDGKGNPRVSVSYECASSTKQDEWIQEWASQYGLRFVQMYVDGGQNREVGPRRHGNYGVVPAGLCIASGPSPRFEGFHAVVWDTRKTTFEMPMGQMVHDPAPVPEGTRPGIKYVNQFKWFEIEDPSLLWKLAELRT